MNKTIFLATAVFVFAMCTNLSGQVVPGALDARDAVDDGIKGRSLELERVKRNADKESSRPEKTPELNFAQIKEDFEQLQVVFDRDVVATYKKSNPINYKLMSDGSDEMKTRASRLRSNLFPQLKQKKGRDKNEVVTPAPLSPGMDVKSLILSLNGTIASFVANPMFQNSKVIDPKDSEKARIDLESIIAQSESLSVEASKLK